jgi:hypothetical protein
MLIAPPERQLNFVLFFLLLEMLATWVGAIVCYMCVRVVALPASTTTVLLLRLALPLFVRSWQI